MKNSVKHLLSLLVMVSFLMVGLLAGIHMGDSVARSHDGPYNGWVCPENDNSSGQCEQNENQTTCTWGSGGCTNGNANPRPGDNL